MEKNELYTKKKTKSDTIRIKGDTVRIKIAFLAVLIVVFGYIGIFTSLNGMFENLAEDVTGQAYSGIPSSFKYKFDKNIPSQQNTR